ncbi:uncharacterized protein LOC122313429 isoform X3 [Carya illinoinensis]|uniref:uncharacterized protein LOC122313429 isoform X3 n=1 Tax=Carya illinoinensis TaxID=32201 RepID=UPI001C7223C3|nr:uncharacterized protein LOC122313429 isoform X3 [Carya illinoinensis]XP_042984414.1 uncharacterized protein LOC122313429 isoform X3 [Carya illinoinensis]
MLLPPNSPSPAIHMDDLEKTHTDCDLWADGMENIFIEMLYGDALTGALRAGNIRSRDHTTYAQRLTSVGIRVYDGNQVKSKLQRLKSRQRLFIDLMSQTGMAWDPDNKTVIANDEHWANALRRCDTGALYRASNMDCPLTLMMTWISSWDLRHHHSLRWGKANVDNKG